MLYVLTNCLCIGARLGMFIILHLAEVSPSLKLSSICDRFPPGRFRCRLSRSGLGPARSPNFTAATASCAELPVGSPNIPSLKRYATPLNSGRELLPQAAIAPTATWVRKNNDERCLHQRR